MRVLRGKLVIASMFALTFVGAALIYKGYQEGSPFAVLDNSVSFARANNPVSIVEQSQRNSSYDWKKSLAEAQGIKAITQAPGDANTGSFTQTASTTLPQLDNEGPLTSAMTESALSAIESTSNPSDLQALAAGSSTPSAVANDPRFAQYVNPTTYSLGDLTTTTTDKNSVADYISHIVGTIQYYSAIHPGNALEIVASSTTGQNPDKSKLSVLPDLAQGYHDLAKALTLIPVPSGFASNDLSLINTLSGFSLAVTNMESVTSDPMRGTLGVEQYTKYMNGYATALNSLYAQAQNYTQ